MSSAMKLSRPPQHVPLDFEAHKQSRSEMIVWSGSDHTFHIRERLALEYKWEALKNPTSDPDVDHHLDLAFQHRITVLYITAFFQDGTDFAMYVSRPKNISKFMLGTFTKKAYDGAFFATPCIDLHPQELFTGHGIRDVVSRTETKGLRWRYLYETARAAWEKLSFDEEAFDKLQEAADSLSDIPDDVSDTTIESTNSDDSPPNDTSLFSFSNEDTEHDLGECDAEEEGCETELPQEMDLS